MSGLRGAGISSAGPRVSSCRCEASDATLFGADGKVGYGVETSPARTMRWKCVPDHRSEQDNHENFLPTVFCPVGHAGVNGEATGAAFFLFLSALGFFFSRLLLNWPFAISSTLLL